MPNDPVLLARLRDVPSRFTAAAILFGGVLVVPPLLLIAGAMVFETLPVLGGLLYLASFLCFCGTASLSFVAILRSRSRLKAAEAALYAGDFPAVVAPMRSVLRLVFRSDHRTIAIYLLALTAERLGAFADAARLFEMSLAALPAFTAERPGRRIRALMTAHAALDCAAIGDVPRADALLRRCYHELGAPIQGGAIDALIDDSGFGPIGVNTLLNEVEARRDPRPLATLAAALVALRAGHAAAAADLFTRESAALARGLAPHEAALASRIHADALRLAAGDAPHRTPGLALPETAHPWVDAVMQRR